MTYNNAWDAWHERPRGRWPDTRFVEFAMRTFGQTPEQSRPEVWFLELGCGGGAQLVFLAEEGFSVHGVDASSAALDKARRLVMRYGAGSRVALRLQDVAEVVTAIQFDCVFDVCTLQHMPLYQVREIVVRAQGWLKPGGVFWSKMAAIGHEVPDGTLAPRRMTLDGVRGLFHGRQVKIGSEHIERADTGLRHSHWIIEARAGDGGQDRAMG